MVPMVKHAQLHWLSCFDQACQVHRYKAYNVLPQGQEYRCQGKKEISWKECTNDSCEGHVKPKIRYGWFPQATPEKCSAPNHNMCRNITCTVHIAGKCESRVFPGGNMARIKEQIEKEQEWSDCKQNIWALCFSPECGRHLKPKLDRGYMPTSLFPMEKVYSIYTGQPPKNF